VAWCTAGGLSWLFKFLEPQFKDAVTVFNALHALMVPAQLVLGQVCKNLDSSSLQLDVHRMLLDEKGTQDIVLSMESLKLSDSSLLEQEQMKQVSHPP
jgi:hypothetical protein